MLMFVTGCHIQHALFFVSGLSVTNWENVRILFYTLHIAKWLHGRNIQLFAVVLLQSVQYIFHTVVFHCFVDFELNDSCTDNVK